MFAIYHAPASAHHFPPATPFPQAQPSYSCSHSYGSNSIIPSALAPRDPNAQRSFFPSPLSFRNKMSTTSASPSNNSRASAPASSASVPTSPPRRTSPEFGAGNLRGTHVKASKYTTLTASANKGTRDERRRRTYLDKVRDGREGKRSEVRAEMGERREWIEERKAWWEEREREGTIGYEFDENGDQAGARDEDLLDEGEPELPELEQVEMEEQMFDEMVQEAERQQQTLSSDYYGSEDEDYERLMMDIATQAEGEPDGMFFSSAREGDQGMDLS